MPWDTWQSTIAYIYLEGYVTSFPGNYSTGSYVITPENIDDAETVKWIYQTEQPR